MIDSILETLAVIDSFLWGPWTMAFLAGVADYFMIRSGVFQQTLGGSGVSSLHPVTAQLVYRLWRQTQVGAHRNTVSGQGSNNIGDFATALQFHHLCAGPHQARGIAQGPFNAAVTHERHVDNT